MRIRNATVGGQGVQRGRGREWCVPSGGGGSGDVLAKVTAGNAVCVRRSKVACRVAELRCSFSFPLDARVSRTFSSLAFFLLSRLCPTFFGLLALLLSPSRAAAAQTTGMHQMQRTDRCSSRSIASTCLLRSCSRAHACFSRPLARSSSTPLLSTFFFVASSSSPSWDGGFVSLCATERGNARVRYSTPALGRVSFIPSTVQRHRSSFPSSPVVDLPSPRPAPPVSFITPPPCERSPLRSVCLDRVLALATDPYVLS